MASFHVQDLNNGSDGPDNGNIQDDNNTRYDATQNDPEQEKIKLREENAELICEIAELCNRPDRKDPEVLLLLGSTGVGKSAMVNTIIKALAGKYFHKAKTGFGCTILKTLAFEWFEHCGIEKFELQGLKKEAFCYCLQQLPNIIDAPGVSAHGSAQVRELLEMLFGGFIPPGTSVKTLRQWQEEGGVGCLKKIYINSRKEWAVTKVVFVASCSQSLPTELIDTIHSILETEDQTTGYFKYNIDVFVVMTKCDLVEGQNMSNMPSASNMIKLDEFKEMENEVAKMFSISGSMEHNSIRWVSYVDGRSLDDPYIDNIALKFVRHMMQPRRRRHRMETDKLPVVTPQMMILLKLLRFINEMNSDQIKRLVAVLAIFIFVVYVSLSKTV